MAECPVIVEADPNPNILTREDIERLQISTRVRTVGTNVKFGCYSDRSLVGVTSSTCKANGQWDYPSKPYCTQGTGATLPPGNGSGTTPTSDLDEQTKVLIAVLCSVAALVLIILLIIVLCVYCRKSRRRRRYRSKRDNYRRDTRSEISSVSSKTSFSRPQFVHHGHYLPPDDRHVPVAYDNPPVVDQLNHVPNPVATVVYVPPPYEPTLIQDLYTGSGSKHKSYSHDGMSYSKAQIGQSIHSPEMAGHLRHPYHNPKTGFVDPAFERRGVYSGEWVDRGSIKNLSRYNKQAAYHGRDPFLWDNKDTNWGETVRKPDW